MTTAVETVIKIIIVIIIDNNYNKHSLENKAGRLEAYCLKPNEAKLAKLTRGCREWHI